MNRISSVMKIHFRDKWSWFIIPWVILLSSFVVNLIISSSINVEEGMVTGGMASIYMYMFVLGIIVLPQTFPFSLGFSVRRTDYFLGTSASFILASAGTALVLMLLSVIESSVIKEWGAGLSFFHLPYWSEGSAIQQFCIYFAVLLNMYFGGFALSSLHKRFGKTAMFVFWPALLLFMSAASYLCTYYGWWDDILQWLGDRLVVGLVLWTIPVTAIYMLVSYMLLRRATV